MRETGLRRADLSGADLTRADLVGARLRGSRLELTKLAGAKLAGTRLERKGKNKVRTEETEMKATCLQESAQRALQITGRVIPARTTMPIVQNTLIRAIEKEIEFTATNLEMTVRIRIPATVEREGGVDGAQQADGGFHQHAAEPAGDAGTAG